MRAELVDIFGNRSGARMPLVLTGTIEPLDVPFLLAPVGNSGAAPYQLALQNVILDSFPTSGLYRARLVDGRGRGWSLWKTDDADPGSVRISVPDIAAAGGLPLANGPIEARIDAFRLPGLTTATTPFLWSDVGRDNDLRCNTFIDIERNH